MKKYSFILPLVTVLLFPANYWICEYLYSDDLNNWWILRTNLSALNFMLALYCIKLEKTLFINFLVNIGLGFSVSDVIDRWLFDTNQFTKSDILMITLTLIICYIEYYVRKRYRNTEA